MPKAYVFTEYGGPGTQALVDVDKPTAGPGELLVAVHAAGVNPVDWKLRSGMSRQYMPMELPAIFGQEASGVVEAVGDGVEGFAPGDEVFGSTPGGAYAEYALMPWEQAARKPNDVSFTDAATLAAAAATAYDGVHQLNLRSGQILLINGVGGGVGVAAAQIARDWELRVIGTASEAKKDFVASLGAEHVTYGDDVLERILALAPDGVDGLLDLVGGDALRAVAPAVRDASKLVSAGDPATAAEFGGVFIERARNAEVLNVVAQLAQAGALKPYVTQVFALDDAGLALDAVESGHAQGKVVIEVQ